MFKLQNGNRVNASDLSSGEQHEIIMLYEMLFMGDQYDLILIDEPEISLHIEWQMEFLSDLEEVLKASKVDVLMATHSVAIARGAKLGLVSLDSPGAR